MNGHKRNVSIMAAGNVVIFSFPWEMVSIDNDNKHMDVGTSPEGAVAIANAIINQVNSMGEE